MKWYHRNTKDKRLAYLRFLVSSASTSTESPLDLVSNLDGHSKILCKRPYGTRVLLELASNKDDIRLALYPQ